MKTTNNFQSITIYNNQVSEEFAEQIVDFLISIPRVCEAFKNRLFVQPNPKDIFILALTELRDTGDIDCLVRALNWQQNTIDSLRHDVDHYHKTLLKLDVVRQECARLQHNLTVLRNRNSELVKALQESKVSIPKRKEYEIKKKNSNPSR